MQKALLASLTIIGLSLTACERPATAASPDAPAQSVDFSKYKTADELWKYLETRADQAGNLQNETDAIALFKVLGPGMEDFITRFPKDDRIVMARLNYAQYALILDQLGAPIAPPDKITAVLREVQKDATASTKDKDTARVLLLNLLAMSGPAEEFVKEVQAYQRDNPKEELSTGLHIMLLNRLVEIDPAKAQKALAEAAQSSDEIVATTAKDYQRWIPMLGKPFNLKFTSVDGQEIDTAKMRGKVILIDFWATWCAPCLQTIPESVDLYKRYHDKGFDILGISLDQSKEKLLELTKAAKMTWPQYFDGLIYDNKISSSFGITSIPQMWLVDKNGNLASITARMGLEQQVKKLLAE